MVLFFLCLKMVYMFLVLLWQHILMVKNLFSVFVRSSNEYLEKEKSFFDIVIIFFVI